jgi:hypothetical protein
MRYAETAPCRSSAGTYKAHFAAFEPSKVYQPSFAVTLLGNTLSVPQYQQQQLPAPQQGARPAVDGLAAAAAAAEETTMVVVNTLTGVNISVRASLARSG